MKGVSMGLFDIFKKKALTPEESDYLNRFENLYNILKSRHHFRDGWTALNIRDPMMSLNGVPDADDLCIQLCPGSPFPVKNKPIDLLLDVSRQTEKSWDDIVSVFKNKTGGVRFFESQFSFSDLSSQVPKKGALPRLEKHGAGVTGFWLWLPLPEQNPWLHPEKFDELVSQCVSVAKEIS